MWVSVQLDGLRRVKSDLGIYRSKYITTYVRMWIKIVYMMFSGIVYV